MKRQIDGSQKRYQQSAWSYFHKKQKFDGVKKQFDEDKDRFETDMLELMDALKKNRVVFEPETPISSGTESGKLTVAKVEKTSIEWDADKLERRLPKSVAKKVIRKKYCIADMQGLTAYLKSCGVDPKVFKTFLAIERTVDMKAIDQLGNVGELSVRQISGCYIVKCHKPYFTLSVKKDDGDDSEDES
jgi:hypothetical protein